MNASVPEAWREAVGQFNASPSADTRQQLSEAFAKCTKALPNAPHRPLLHYLRSQITTEAAQRCLIEGASDPVIAEHLAPAILVLANITQAASPAIQEALTTGEKVHQINEATPLANRQSLAGSRDADKQLMGLFLPYDLTTPLVAVQAKFMQESEYNGLPSLRISELLSTPPQTVKQTNSCYFYSITNLVMGDPKLKEIGAYHELILRAAETLSGNAPEDTRSLPNGLEPVRSRGITRACTLSPMRPTLANQQGFMDWMRAKRQDVSLEYLKAHPEAAKAWGLHYLETPEEKGRATSNLVAHIHCRNGAAIRGFIPEAEDTILGQSGAAGLMVSYEYPLDELERRSNKERYRSGQLSISERAEHEDIQARQMMEMEMEFMPGLRSIAATLEQRMLPLP